MRAHKGTARQQSMTVLDQLRPYMFCGQPEPTPLAMTAASYTAGLAVAPTRPPKPAGVFVPRQKDTLWWCFYIMSKGLADYQRLVVTDALERQLKIAQIMVIKYGGAPLDARTGPHPSTGCFAKLEATVAHAPRIDLDAFFALCAATNKGVFYVDAPKKTYWVSGADKDAEIIVSVGDGRYGIDIEGVESQYRHTHLLVDRAKPIKAIGSYTAAELTAMAATLGVALPPVGDKKRTKAQNYELIRQAMGV